MFRSKMPMPFVEPIYNYSTTPTIENYLIIERDNAYDLAEAVSNLIKDGWQPYGDLNAFASTKYMSGIAYQQVVVKYK